MKIRIAMMAACVGAFALVSSQSLALGIDAKAGKNSGLQILAQNSEQKAKAKTRTSTNTDKRKAKCIRNGGVWGDDGGCTPQFDLFNRR